jgi:Transposase domain (DUF772)
VRSSRQIQRCCIQDLAFRVLAGNQTPDHVTIARFRVRHEQALAGFLVASLRLCAAAGMIKLGTVAAVSMGIVAWTFAVLGLIRVMVAGAQEAARPSRSLCPCPCTPAPGP